MSNVRPGGVGLVGEQLAQLVGDGVIGMGRVVLRVQQQPPGRGDRRDDVDVAVRAELVVVAGEAARQPDRGGRADRAGELRLDARLVGVRVAAVVELHGLGQQHGAFAVDVDAAALVHEHRADQLRPDECADDPRDLGGLAPFRPRRVAPAVERPVDRAEHAGALVVDDERRAEVAHPELVERRLDELDLAAQHAARASLLGRIDHHRERLELRDGVRDRGPRGVALLGLRGGVAEGRALARERHPGAIVRRGLRGHAPGHRCPLVQG